MTADAVPDELAAALRDPQSMTPQLADAATLVSNLPPEEQQRLMEAARASAQVTGGRAATRARLSVARPTLPPLLPHDEATDGPACPLGVERMIPSRQKLLTELAVRRFQLESLRNTVVRLNRTIQRDQQ